eukprot:5749061-Ditylum_brightwellii.AAC.1
MVSAAEAKIGALYTNARKGEEFCMALQELDHPQLPTPIMTDNTTANGIVYWRPRDENKGDYHTRHHPVTHHINMRKQYLHEANDL